MSVSDAGGESRKPLDILLDVMNRHVRIVSALTRLKYQTMAVITIRFVLFMPIAYRKTLLKVGLMSSVIDCVMPPDPLRLQERQFASCGATARHSFNKELRSGGFVPCESISTMRSLNALTRQSFPGQPLQLLPAAG
jgi:hypothetical protein